MRRSGRAAAGGADGGRRGKLTARLRFALALGERAAFLEEDAELPEDGPPWEAIPWRAWMELVPERPYVPVGVSVPMGGTVIQPRPCPLPWSVLQTWCDRARLSESERAFVVEVVRALDREFLAHWAAQQNRPARQTLEDKLARWDAA